MNSISLSIILIAICSFNAFSTSIVEDIQSKQDKNPALLVEEDNPHFKLAYGSNLSDFSRSMQLKILDVNGLYQTYCFNHNVLLSDDYHNQTHRLYFSDGFTPWNRLSCGFNLGTEIEKDGKDFRRNLFFDMGFLYKLTSNQIFGDHSIGVAVQNVLSSSVQRKMWHCQPVNTKISWWTNILNRRINAGFDCYIEDCMSDNPEISYLSNLGFNRYPFTVNALAGREYAGGSFSYTLVTPGLHTFSLLMQYVRNIRREDPGKITFTCVANLERAREEKYSKRIGHISYRSYPNNYYITGVNYYNNGKYIDALAIFSQLSECYPDFIKKEWYPFFIIDSYHLLGMLKTAKWKASMLKNISINSQAYPFISLTLLRIAIEEHSEEDIVKYQRVFQDSVKKNDSLKQVAAFLVAEYKFATNDFLSALIEYSKLKPGHPLYRVAQYSMASIYLYQKNQNKLNEVISILQKHKTNSNIDLINRLRSIAPISVEKFKVIEDSIKKERINIEGVYDSLGFAVDNALKGNQSMAIIKRIDSLQEIQKSCFEVIEKDRLLQNTVHKKWQILGNELLKYLNKDELDVLEKCWKVVGESN